MKLIAYLRVSKEDQVESGLGLEAQESTIREFSARIAKPIEEPLERDEGVSGATPAAQREALQRAIGRIEKGDGLVVSRRDRLARDVFEAMLVEKRVEELGGRILSAAGEGTENDDPTSKLLRRIVDAFAEYERAMISFRTKKALGAKKERGERLGAPPYGYQLDKKTGDLVPVAHELETIRLMVAWRCNGLSFGAIARDLNERGVPAKRGGRWSASGVQSILDSEERRK